MAAKLHTVLIGTSLDDASTGVVKVGAGIARAAGARVHLVHAFTPTADPGSEWGFSFGTDGLLRAEEERLRSALAGQAGQLGEGAGWSLESGAAHRVLPELAERLDAGLIVVGASEGRVARLLGSTADRVIRKSHRPVLVVRGGLGLPLQKVLAPVDLSPLSAEAFREGLSLLAALGSLPEIEALFVLSVLQRQVAPQFTPEQIDRFAAEELDRFVTANAGESAARVRRKVRTGNVREEVLAEIAHWRPDLVFLGTHGIGGFDRMVIGSVAADVVRESPSSVLVIPPAEAAAQS